MKLPSLRNLVTDDLAVDLGTARTRVFARGRGIVVNEPSLLAFDTHSNEVVAVGMEALELEGRSSDNVQIFSPMQDGVVADANFAGKLLESYVRKARDGRSLQRRVLISTPADATDIERYALRYAGREAGVSNVHFIDKGLAATLGSGYNAQDEHATFVVDIGAGTTTMAAMIRDHLIFSKTLRIGGNDLDEAVVAMIKQNHSLQVGPRTAERVKIELGCAVTVDHEQTTSVRGRSTVTGAPEMAVVNSIEIHDAIAPVVGRIVKGVQDALESLPPEASGDIYDRGLVVAGGCSLLAGMDERLARDTELHVALAESPARAVIRGLGILFDDPLKLRKAGMK